MQKINFISYLKLRVNLDLGMRNKKVTSEIWIYKDDWRSAVKLLREKGMGIKQIARELQIGVGTVYSVMSV